jgi:four helix bundle protein
MATFNTFEDIGAWQEARVLTREVYAITRSASFSRDFALRDQIRRAAISIAANIAESFERNGTTCFLQFLSIAKGSSGEVRS